MIMADKMDDKTGSMTSCVTWSMIISEKKEEPGIKFQKADFFRNDTWTSPQTNSPLKMALHVATWN